MSSFHVSKCLDKNLKKELFTLQLSNVFVGRASDRVAVIKGSVVFTHVLSLRPVITAECGCGRALVHQPEAFHPDRESKTSYRGS